MVGKSQFYFFILKNVLGTIKGSAAKSTAGAAFKHGWARSQGKWGAQELESSHNLQKERNGHPDYPRKIHFYF